MTLSLKHTTLPVHYNRVFISFQGIATASPGGHHHGDHDSDSGSSATVSNSDSGRGASSEEGDVNTRLSLEALDEAPNEDGSPETG